MVRSLVLVWALLPACSIAFVKDPSEASRKDPKVPVECTSSNALPVLDVFVGALLGAFVGRTTYLIAGDHHDCPGKCPTGAKEAIIATALVVSPFALSSIVGFSHTKSCRDLQRSRGRSP